jgi:biopolymer transport protein TolR
MGMCTSSQKGMKSEINITPYIDILLVLLIIFMVVTPVKQMDLRVKVPQLPPPRPIVQPRVDTIVVTVGAGAQIEINHIPTDIAALGAKLQEIYSARANKDMFISASPTLPYGDVVRVIDISKGAGVGDIGLLSGEVRQ